MYIYKPFLTARAIAIFDIGKYDLYVGNMIYM